MDISYVLSSSGICVIPEILIVPSKLVDAAQYNLFGVVGFSGSGISILTAQSSSTPNKLVSEFTATISKPFHSRAL
jgi:hypothetical protein